MMESLKDASQPFEYERLAHYLERPGFRITEIQISRTHTQQVPWHYHSDAQDTCALYGWASWDPGSGRG